MRKTRKMSQGTTAKVTVKIHKTMKKIKMIYKTLTGKTERMKSSKVSLIKNNKPTGTKSFKKTRSLLTSPMPNALPHPS